MSTRFSSFGLRFTRHTGALELMEDLGDAIAEDSTSVFLGGGNPAKIPEVQKRLRSRLAEIAGSDELSDRLAGNYSHPKGELKFRESLARLLTREYGWRLTAENIAVTAGSQAGFFLLFNLLAGDFPDGSRKRILLPLVPEYIGYADVGLSDDLFIAKRPQIEILSDNFFKYRIDFNALSVGRDIGAICVSRPTNPTGNVITDNELEKLNDEAAAAGIPLIIDSAYGPPFPKIVFVDAQPLWNENVIYCMSLSKLGIPGVRTGMIIANEAVVDAFMRMTAVMSLAVGSVGPVMVEGLIDTGEILDWSTNLIRPFYEEKARTACALLKRELDGLPFRIHAPEGAFFLWLWLPELSVSSAELYQRLKQRDVIVLSGHHFFPGLSGEWPHRHQCLRISFAQETAALERGMRAIGAEIRELHGRG